MAEREAIYKLKFQVDKSGQQESIHAIDALANEFAEVDENAQRVSRSAQNAVQKLASFGRGRDELQSTANEAKEVAVATDGIASALNHVDAASDSIERVQDQMRNARKETERTEQAIKGLESRLDAADENFDVISRRVGLAGDVQSNIGAVRGIADLSGLEKQANAVGIAGEIVVLTEELPRLKLALQNMPDVVRFAATSIGATGVGLIGALAALGVVTAIAAKQTREQQAVQDAKFAADQQVTDFLRDATPQEALDRQRELAALIEEQGARVDELNAKYKAGTDAVKEAIPVFGTLAVVASENNLPGATGIIKSYSEEIEKSSTALQKNKEEYKLLSQAIEDGGTQAQLAAAAEERLRNARQQSETEFIAALENRNRRLIQAGQLIATGTEDEVKARVDAIAQEKTAIESTIKDLEQFTGRTLEQLLDDTSLDPATIQTLQGYVNQLRALDEEMGILEGKTFSLAKAHSALNSALANQEEITKERINQIKEQAQSELEFNRFLKTATTENVAARIEALQEEAAALRSMLPELEKLAPTSEAAADELRATTDRISEIDAQLRQLGSEGVIAAIQREQAQLTEEIIRIEQARDERIAQLREQAARKEAELYEDLQRDLADAVADANEERAEAQREYQEEAAQIERDLARKRLDIEKKYSRDAANAIGDRDALALYQAKQTRDEQLTDAQDAAQQAREDLQRNYAQQLDTINRELEKQRQALYMKYQQQLNDLRTQTANSIALERQKAAQEIQARQQAYQQELALLNSFAQSGVTSISQFTTNSVAQLGTFVQQAQSIMAGLISSIGSGGGSNTDTTPIPPIVNRPPGAPGGPQPAPTISIRVEGYTKEVIASEIFDVLKQVIPN